MEGFYVTAIDGGKKKLMRGPFVTHAEALALVDVTFKACDAIDPRAWFLAWGTSKLTADTLPAGNYDKYLAANGGVN